ncbi:hypothetical protein BD289DRAFT_133139 [Coniella lustricola]|uniref:Uncharacterized protein n=1 Tax=Coniella lustricola TaxID=2025994 RepID=A0A2T2ZVV8_9PEZI|nr:hypothetical protein BD289DRAFT_133139 [Coniella lustricola]
MSTLLFGPSFSLLLSRLNFGFWLWLRAVGGGLTRPGRPSPPPPSVHKNDPRQDTAVPQQQDRPQDTQDTVWAWRRASQVRKRASKLLPCTRGTPLQRHAVPSLVSWPGAKVSTDHQTWSLLLADGGRPLRCLLSRPFCIMYSIVVVVAVWLYVRMTCSLWSWFVAVALLWRRNANATKPPYHPRPTSRCSVTPLPPPPKKYKTT